MLPLGNLTPDGIATRATLRKANLLEVRPEDHAPPFTRDTFTGLPEAKYSTL